MLCDEPEWTVSTEVKGNSKRQVFVTIDDTGQGIHPEIESRLFSKFASKSFRGTGLGLFISKSIVEAHGGKIWRENNSYGKGATFTFNLPVGPYRLEGLTCCTEGGNQRMLLSIKIC